MSSNNPEWVEITVRYAGAKVTRKYEIHASNNERNPLQFANIIEEILQAIDNLEDLELWNTQTFTTK